MELPLFGHTLGVSVGRAGRTLGKYRSTQRNQPRGCQEEVELFADILVSAKQYDPYVHRRIEILLRTARRSLTDRLVEWIRWHEGVKIPAK